jgi:hypothetical protein
MAFALFGRKFGKMALDNVGDPFDGRPALWSPRRFHP